MPLSTTTPKYPKYSSVGIDIGNYIDDIIYPIFGFLNPISVHSNIGLNFDIGLANPILTVPA
jgi:hypothetical protein